MKLTKAQRRIVEALVKGDILIQCGLVACLDSDSALRRPTNGALVKWLLQNMLVQESDWSRPGYRVYEANSWCKRVLTEPDFEPLVELCILSREQDRMMQELKEEGDTDARNRRIDEEHEGFVQR